MGVPQDIINHILGFSTSGDLSKLYNNGLYSILSDEITYNIKDIIDNEYTCLIKLLLDYKIINNYTEINGSPILFYVIKINRYYSFKILIEGDINPYILDNEGNSLLSWSVLNNIDYRIFNLLLRYGLDINHKNINGTTPLHNACMINYSMIHNILDKGGDPNIYISTSAGKIIPIYFIIKNKNPDKYKYIKLLLDYGSNPNFNGLLSSTILFNDMQSFELLLQYGANPNEMTGSGTIINPHQLINFVILNQELKDKFLEILDKYYFSV